jgi:hypothetical protein
MLSAVLGFSLQLGNKSGSTRATSPLLPGADRQNGRNGRNGNGNGNGNGKNGPPSSVNQEGNNISNHDEK